MLIIILIICVYIYVIMILIICEFIYSYLYLYLSLSLYIYIYVNNTSTINKSSEPPGAATSEVGIRCRHGPPGEPIAAEIITVLCLYHYDY